MIEGDAERQAAWAPNWGKKFRHRLPEKVCLADSVPLSEIDNGRSSTGRPKGRPIDEEPTTVEAT